MGGISAASRAKMACFKDTGSATRITSTRNQRGDPGSLEFWGGAPNIRNAKTFEPPRPPKKTTWKAFGGHGFGLSFGAPLPPASASGSAAPPEERRASRHERKKCAPDVWATLHLRRANEYTGGINVSYYCGMQIK
eukprot:6824214-Pyramimonas_sp.AAC.1